MLVFLYTVKSNKTTHLTFIYAAMDLFLVLERIMGVYDQCPESETGLVEHDLRRETET